MSAAAVVVVGCGGGDDTGGGAESTSTAATSQSPTKQANSYALDQSGGEKEGCLEGPVSAGNPGCVYSAAFAGCLAGRTGSAPDWSLKHKLPPGDLRPIYERGVKDCNGG